MSGTRYDGMLVRILLRALKAERASNWGYLMVWGGHSCRSPTLTFWSKE
jgi:hypothetical protein